MFLSDYYDYCGNSVFTANNVSEKLVASESHVLIIWCVGASVISHLYSVPDTKKNNINAMFSFKDWFYWIGFFVAFFKQIYGFLLGV